MIKVSSKQTQPDSRSLLGRRVLNLGLATLLALPLSAGLSLAPQSATAAPGRARQPNASFGKQRTLIGRQRQRLERARARRAAQRPHPRSGALSKGVRLPRSKRAPRSLTNRKLSHRYSQAQKELKAATQQARSLFREAKATQDPAKYADGMRQTVKVIRSKRRLLKARIKGIKQKISMSVVPGHKAKLVHSLKKLKKQRSRLGAKLGQLERHFGPAEAKGPGNDKELAARELAQVKAYAEQLQAQKQEQGEQPALAKPTTFKAFNAYVRNGRNGGNDLDKAMATFMRLDAKTQQKSGLGKVWHKVRMAKAERKLRRANERLGKRGLRSAEDLDLLGKQHASAPEVLKLVKSKRAAINRAVKAGEISAEQARLLRQDVQAEIREVKSRSSDYQRARRGLKYLKARARKRGRIRRVVSGLASVLSAGLIRSAAQSDRALDRASFRALRQQTKRDWSGYKHIKPWKFRLRSARRTVEGIEGAQRAEILLLDAKARGLAGTRRYKRARKRAEKRVTQAIRTAKFEAKPEQVELGYLLAEAYKMDKSLNDYIEGYNSGEYQLSEKRAAKMDKDIEIALRREVSSLAKWAQWIAEHQDHAQKNFNWNKALAVHLNAAVRQGISKKIDVGERVSLRLRGRVDKTDKQLDEQSPGFVKMALMMPLKVMLSPYTLSKKFLVGEYRALKYPTTGGIPPPPVSIERANYLIQKYLPGLKMPEQQARGQAEQSVQEQYYGQ